MSCPDFGSTKVGSDLLTCLAEKDARKQAHFVFHFVELLYTFRRTRMYVHERHAPAYSQSSPEPPKRSECMISFIVHSRVS